MAGTSPFIILALVAFVAINNISVFGHEANGQTSTISWLRNAHIYKDADHVERRILRATTDEVDEHILSGTRVTVEDGNGHAVSDKLDSCYVSPVLNGMRVYCNNKLVSGMVTEPGDGSTTYVQRISDEELVSYDQNSVLVQKHLENKRTCSHESHDHDHADHDHDDMHHESPMNTVHEANMKEFEASKPAESKPHLRNLQADFQQTALKFVDVQIVVDAATSRLWGNNNRNKIEAKVVSIIAIAKQMFLQFRAVPFGVNIRLAGIHIFTGNDPITVDGKETQSTELLNKFNTWRMNQKTGNNGLAPHTVAHLFTANNLNDLVGAYARPVACESGSSSTLSYSQSESEGYLAKLLAHAIGHSLGLMHTSQYSPAWGVDVNMAMECIGLSNDVMRSVLPVDSAAFAWGKCGPVWFKSFLTGYPHNCDPDWDCTALAAYGRRSDYPMCMESTSTAQVKDKLGVCGDGVVDTNLGEQCDCGPLATPEECARISCCDMSQCRNIPNCVGTRAPTFGQPTRRPTNHPTFQENAECYHWCFGNANGRCEDGGPGSVSFICPYGSDCIDCGIREPYTRGPTAPTITLEPTLNPTTLSPTKRPTTLSPTKRPTTTPTVKPSNSPTLEPTAKPTNSPTLEPTKRPTTTPTFKPSNSPTPDPTKRVTSEPTKRETPSPTTGAPTTLEPTRSPTTSSPTWSPTKSPTVSAPTVSPSTSPTKRPTTKQPTSSPVIAPTPLPCPSPDKLNNCRVGAAGCKDECNLCNNKGDKKCVAQIPSFIPSISTCSGEHIDYIKQCIDRMKDTQAPSASSPTLPDDAGAKTCPSANQISRCAGVAKNLCQSRTQCSFCNTPNGKSSRCFANVNGIPKCSEDHINFVKSCMNESPDDDGTMAPTPTETAPTVEYERPDALTCPPVSAIEACRVGPNNCGKGAASKCVYCGKCMPLMPDSGLEVCSDKFTEIGRTCMQLHNKNK